MVCGWALTLFSALLLVPGGGGGEEPSPRSDASGGAFFAPLAQLANAAPHAALLVSVPALGAGAALVIIPSLPDMQRGLDAAGRTAACVLWNGAYAGGSALGPLASVMLFERQGWGTIVQMQAAISVAVAALLAVSMCRDEAK